MSAETVIHSGGCHCGHVRWQVEASPSVVAWSCNCSDCSMRGNVHFIVPSAKFKLIGDSEKFLTTYTFGTHTAKHTFCRVCGITSFYFPRSNPDGVAVTFKCVDSGTLRHIEIRCFDGRNWEKSYDQSSVSSFSKLSGESHHHQ
ncbi:centromere protein V [Phoenix dactylifera]|uniref:Centromere protein V n=1 Tax=Phoenix dactylifera TaxID=42345 RepID=A0A8B7C0T1_PHODC|nr:centromere protein V [Phoenix dactylifera]